MNLRTKYITFQICHNKNHFDYKSRRQHNPKNTKSTNFNSGIGIPAPRDAGNPPGDADSGNVGEAVMKNNCQ